MGASRTPLPQAVLPPRDEAELLERARSLRGTSIEAIGARFAVTLERDAVRTKGKVGALLERALGATGGSRATWDFPELRIELKSVPVDASGAARESTFVCTMPLRDADRLEWDDSWVRAKLARVLWVPVRCHDDGSRFVEEPLLWSPAPEQERVLAADFEEIAGRIGAGDLEAVTGRVGRWLQLRPKAAHGRVRTFAPGADGDVFATVPRGFYLRSLFTGALLRDPAAVPPDRRKAR